MAANKEITKIRDNISQKLSRCFGVSLEEATIEQIYEAVAMTLTDILSEKKQIFQKEVDKKGAKKVSYFCMEFLLGRSLKNNLCNLGLAKSYEKVLKEYGISLNELYECEPDAGLGNGGLGRLAACFMDSAATLNYPCEGYSICYEYGLFKQKIMEDGLQIELPDNWLPGGTVWLMPRTDKKCRVRFGGQIKEIWNDYKLEIVYENAEEIEAVPYDMLISGYDCEAVSKLRLWKAKDIDNFNMSLFSEGQYKRALEPSVNAEIICKVLYPSDNHYEGKLLRLTQQYFMVSASCQSIVREHISKYKDIKTLPEKVAIHINDTHPALCIPELMRIFMDDYCIDWDTAWNMVKKTVTFTNHTVMPEALEMWNEELFKIRLPRIYMIVKEINERYCRAAWDETPGDWKRISEVAPICNGFVKMANIAVIASEKVNGVSKIHSDILKKDTFKNYYKSTPEKFDNVTNGVAHRRWLCFANPLLSDFLCECIGDSFIKSPEDLLNFSKFKNDNSVLEKLGEIKKKNKERFAKEVFERSGIVLNTESVFDVQIKRLHEYKRQLLNVMNIVGLYLTIKENPNCDIIPRTFIFGAKAAPGYRMAKEIIKLIWCVGKEIELDEAVRGKIKILFLEDYNVTVAEKLVPAAEVSEQISLAGKEASGTGCMKLMLNGALTVGTLDGANIEMSEQAGAENMFIFGLTANEVKSLFEKGYHSADYYNQNYFLQKIVNRFGKGFYGQSFSHISEYLLASDPFMCMADFEPYRMVQDEINEKYRDRQLWNKMSLMNIAGAGKFSSDRSINEYADRIWGIKPVTKDAD